MTDNRSVTGRLTMFGVGGAIAPLRDDGWSGDDTGKCGEADAAGGR